MDDIAPDKLAKVLMEREDKDVTYYFYFQNCRDDAFKTAFETLRDRRSRFGAGSPEVTRWVEAQLKVFGQCADDSTPPPSQPGADWSRLEKQDRHYQIAAWLFYNRQYLKAAEVFRTIAADETSPWSALSQYLVPRSLTRQASINMRDREHNFNRALSEYRALAKDPDYLAEFPSITRMITEIQIEIDPWAIVAELEARVIESPGVLGPSQVHDLQHYLQLGYWGLAGAHPEYEAWRWFASGRLDGSETARNEILARWRAQPTLPWLFLATRVADAHTDTETLENLLDAASKVSLDSPGGAAIGTHRVRLSGFVAAQSARLDQVEALERGGKVALHFINRLRMEIADLEGDKRRYLQWTSLLPLDLFWSGAEARRLPRQ